LLTANDSLTWDFGRTHSDHLWITHDGQTEEYKCIADC
jgi:hypothetical protein